MESKEKPIKKIRNKTINYNKKNVNPLLMHIEEYSKAMDIINKEINKNKEMHEFEDVIFDTFTQIKEVTNEYCDKMREISKDLSPNDKNCEGRIQKLIFDILTNFANIMSKSIEKFEADRKMSIIVYEEYKKNIEDLNSKFSEKIEKLNVLKRNYFEEINKYEEFLIKEDLGLLNENETNKKEKKKKDKNKEKNLIDNNMQVREQQQAYISTIKDLKSNLKTTFGCLFTERKLIFQTLNLNWENLLKYFNAAFKNISTIIDEQAKDLENNSLKFDEDINNKDNVIDNIIKEELYSFKFLSINQNDEKEEVIEEDPKNKKKKKDKDKDKDKDKKDNNEINSLLEKLQEKNIYNLITIIKKHGIILTKEDSDKVEIYENKQYIESLIQLIIENPDKFDEEKKNNLLSLFEKNEENQNSFMTYLNNYRAKGSFELKKSSLKLFCDLFTFILDLAVKNNNYRMIQFAMILSLTYYHLDEEKKDEDKNNNNKINIKDDDGRNKIYMTKYLKNSEPLKKKEYWLNYLQALIDDELQKINKRKEKNINEKQKSVAVYSSVFTLIKNMIDYDLDFKFIDETVLQEINDQYKLKDEEKQNIVNFLLTEIQEKEKKNK